MKPLAIVLALAIVSGLPSAARADKTAANACADAYTRGQILRNSHKLREARDALRTCAQPSCKAFIVRDCAQWLDEVQASLPTVVPVATDGAGSALPAVKVSMDGALLLEASDGRAVEVDPGPHTFVFEGPDGARNDKTVLVLEGEKDKRVVVTFATPKGSAKEAAPTPDTATAPPSETAAAASPSETPASRRVPPWKIVGLAAAGAGVVSAGVGAIFGLEAISRKSNAGCDANSVCRDNTGASTLKSAGSAGDLATVFFVAGGVLAAGGITLWALAPQASVRVAPSVGRNRAGLTVEGEL